MMKTMSLKSINMTHSVAENTHIHQTTETSQKSILYTEPHSKSKLTVKYNRNSINRCDCHFNTT